MLKYCDLWSTITASLASRGSTARRSDWPEMQSKGAIMRFLSTAPRHIRTRYLRGGCWVLAIELAKHTGLQLWGIRDGQGNLHHAFVADGSRGIAIDIRGSMPLENVVEGCAAMDPKLEPIGKDEILSICGSFSRTDIREAKRVIATMLIVPSEPENATRSEGMEP